MTYGDLFECSFVIIIFGSLILALYHVITFPQCFIIIAIFSITLIGFLHFWGKYEQKKEKQEKFLQRKTKILKGIRKIIWKD